MQSTSGEVGAAADLVYQSLFAVYLAGTPKGETRRMSVQHALEGTRNLLADLGLPINTLDGITPGKVLAHLAHAGLIRRDSGEYVIRSEERAA